jgi:hypothetical protein
VTVPAMTANSTVSRATMPLVEAPAMMRLATSRPNSSVPSQWAAEGACNLARRLTASGS